MARLIVTLLACASAVVCVASLAGYLVRREVGIYRCDTLFCVASGTAYAQPIGTFRESESPGPFITAIFDVWKVHHRFAGFEFGRGVHHHTRFVAETMRVGVPLWFIALVAAFLPGLWLRAALISRRQLSCTRSGCCVTCGYDLRASRQRCPECGAVAGPTLAAIPPERGSTPAIGSSSPDETSPGPHHAGSAHSRSSG
jgi:hypothetical protein